MPTMTPEHGYLLLAIGAALFASLLVVIYGRKPFAWYRLWRRRRTERLADLDAARQEFAHACDKLGVSRAAAAFSLSLSELDDPDALRRYAQKMREQAQPKAELPSTNTITVGPQFGKPAPYAPIAGTGSRPEAPWVTREEAAKLAFNILTLCGFDGVTVDVTGGIITCDPKPPAARGDEILKTIGYDDGYEYRACAEPSLESKRGGEGVRVWAGYLHGYYLRDTAGQEWFDADCDGGWKRVAAGDIERGCGPELPPTDPRYAAVLESWRERKGA